MKYIIPLLICSFLSTSLMADEKAPREAISDSSTVKKESHNHSMSAFVHDLRERVKSGEVTPEEARALMRAETSKRKHHGKTHADHEGKHEKHAEKHEGHAEKHAEKKAAEHEAAKKTKATDSEAKKNSSKGKSDSKGKGKGKR